MNERTVIDCPKCKQRFSVEMPVITTINTPTFSQMIAPHTIFFCQNAKCAAPLSLALVGAQVNWQVTIVDESAIPNRVIPFAQMPVQ